MKNLPLVIIAGPTAVGKTALSVELAKKIHGAVISADSMQIYKYMDIGSAKIMPDEMQGVKHYLIDELEPDDDFNIVRFQQMGTKALQEIYQNGQIPIIAGGTGFYIQSLLYNIDFSQTDADYNYRTELENFAKKYGNEALHEKLRSIDPVSFETIHPNNVKRVIRALEYYKQTNSPISLHNETERQKKSPYNFVYIVLTDERDKLYERIDRRVDLMIEKGLVDEVKKLEDMGCNKDMVSMQGLGYKEILDYLDGNCSLADAIEKIKLETRHFAKRQITWFKREPEVIWINRSDYNNDERIMLSEVIRQLELKGVISNDTDKCN